MLISQILFRYTFDIIIRNKGRLRNKTIFQVYDGSTTSGLRLHSGNGFTQSSKPKITLTASSGEMLVRFATDALHSNKGWTATFSAGKIKLPHFHISDRKQSNFLFRLSTFTTWNRCLSI